MAVPFIYLKDTESDEDNFNRSQAAPPNAKMERLDDSGSSETTTGSTTESTTESTKEKCLSAKEKKALKKKKEEEEAEKDVFDQTQQKYYLPQVGSYLIMEFEGKAYVVVVEKRYSLSVEVRVRFYESWDNGDSLTTKFKFEDGTRAHARVPARHMCRVIVLGGLPR